MDAWKKIVEDIQKFSNPPEKQIEKTFLQRMWNIVFKDDGCAGDCHQGRKSCACK